MLGSGALDVLIGLTFIYFVLSIVCSALIESVAGLCALRARSLHDAIASLLGSSQAACTLLKNPVIAPLAGPQREGMFKDVRDAFAGRGANLPQYIPPDRFVTALLDSVAKQQPTPSTSLAGVARYQTFANAAARATKTPDPVHAAMQAFVARTTAELPTTATSDADRLQHLRAQFEDWYTDTMDRATGWYKRKTQVLLFCFAIPLVALVNIDTVALTKTLFASKDTRAALAIAATQAATQPAPNPSASPSAAQDSLHQNVAELDRLSLPLGWDRVILKNMDAFDWITKLLGLLLTIAAVSLGAPFWFDMLSKISNLRNAAPKPTTADPTPATPSFFPTVLSPASPPAFAAPASPAVQLPDNYWARSSHANDWKDFTTLPAIPRQSAALARAALLAYQSEPVARALLVSSWSRIVDNTGAAPNAVKTFLDPGGAQAFIAAWDDFLVVSFRGTQSTELADIVDDACCNLISRPDLAPGAVHTGFAASLDERLPALDAYLAALLTAKPRPVFITGHSLGAALATLYAAHLTVGKPPFSPPAVTLITFGSPRVGDTVFATALESALHFDRTNYTDKIAAGTLTSADLSASRLFRYIDHNDVVTRVPPRDNTFDHAGPTLYLRADGSLDLSMTEWRRYLNSLTDVISQFRTLAHSSLADHSMEKYLMTLENLADPRT